MQLKNLKRNNLILLICLLFLIFVHPLLPGNVTAARSVMQTAIFFSGIFSLDFSNKTLKVLLPLGVVTTTTTWTEYLLESEFTHLLDVATTFLFLVAIVVMMTRHIARSRDVTPTIILSSINGFLLIGILGGALLAIANADFFYGPSHLHGIAFPGDAPPLPGDYIYFSFITLTTLGYGDITPVSELSRSLAVLIAITGQLYMTILIAMLVGKFLSRPKSE
jgi:voltage-gated potassium channel